MHPHPRTAHPDPQNEVGYDEQWRGRIVTENPERYKIPAATGAGAAEAEARKLRIMQGKSWRRTAA